MNSGGQSLLTDHRAPKTAGLPGVRRAGAVAHAPFLMRGLPATGSVEMLLGDVDQVSSCLSLPHCLVSQTLCLCPPAPLSLRGVPPHPFLGSAGPPGATNSTELGRSK